MLRIQSENNLDLDLHRHKFLDFCETNTDKKNKLKECILAKSYIKMLNAGRLITLQFYQTYTSTIENDFEMAAKLYFYVFSSYF